MSQASDTSKLTTYLDSLETALSDGNPADVLAFLRVLRMNGLDGEASVRLVAAFSDSPEPSHFEQAAKWISEKRAELSHDGDAQRLDDDDPFGLGDLVSIGDDISDFDLDEGSEGLDAFVSVDDDDVGLDELSLDDALDVDSSNDAFDPFEDLTANEDSSAPDSADSFPASEKFSGADVYGSDHTPPPSGTTEQADPVPASSLADEFGSDTFHTPASASSTITGEREKTVELDGNHLQALSKAASVARDAAQKSTPDPLTPSPEVGSGASTAEYEAPSTNGPEAFDGSSEDAPPEEEGQVSVHERPTKRQFRADEASPSLEERQSRQTAEKFEVSESDADSDDDFDFDFDLEPAAQDSESEDDDDFDFDLEPAAQDSESEDDDFDFDLKPEPASEPSESEDDDFDFDLKPEPASEPSESEDDDFDFDLKPEPASEPSESEDDDFDFDLAPEPSSPSVESEHESLDTDNSSSIDESMGYASPPEDNSFFPPPIQKDNDQEEEGEQEHTPTPSPFPESPSIAAGSLSEPTSEPAGVRTSQRPEQPTPVGHNPHVEALQQSQKTPARGTTPLPDSSSASTTNDDPLFEEELLALGEELSSGMASSSNQADNVAPDEEATPSEDNAPSYRGEPLLRELGDEPTPDRQFSDDESADPFDASEHSSEETNPFAEDVPTGVGQNPVGMVDRSSFVLEEVEASDAAVDSPEEAISAALDQARALYENADFDAASELIEDVLEVDEQSERALELKSLVEGEIEREIINKLGSVTITPILSISMAEIPKLDIDHRAGFLLSQIDGMLTLEDILDMSAMPRLETLSLVADLFDQDIIGFD